MAAIKLNSSRILVTGGAGFIGSNFVHHCLKGKHRPEGLVVLDLLTYAGNRANIDGLRESPGFHFVEGDIGDEKKVAQLLGRHDITAIVNFAAESHVDRSIDSPEPFFQTNVMGTLRLLNATRQYWTGLPDPEKRTFRFLHVSTDEVYGSLGSRDPAFTETTAYAPNSPYAASKAGSDHLVRSFFHTFGMPVVTTNCSNNYGPYQFPEKLIPLVILNALEEKPLPIYGDGLNIRDWLYVRDHCEALLRVLLGGRPGEVYNVGGQCERTNLETVDAICSFLDALVPRASGESYSELKTFVPDRPGHDRRYAIDCRKIREELEWEPRETFESGLEKTVCWYVDHREWCREITESRYQRQRLGHRDKAS